MSVFRRRTTQIFAPCHILRAAACLGKLLTSAKTRFCLRNVVARQRAFFDGAPLKFSLPATFHARQRALANCLLRQKRVFVYETLSQDNERFSTARHLHFRRPPNFTRGGVPHRAKISHFLQKYPKFIKNTTNSNSLLTYFCPFFNSFLTNWIKSATLYPILKKAVFK